jgi:hypothetical protein
MQDEHAFIWTAMLETIDIELTGKPVLTPAATGVAFAGGWSIGA